MYEIGGADLRRYNVLDLGANSPFRPADWRAHRARMTDRRRVDADVRRIRRFLRADENPAYDADLAKAFAIHRDRSLLQVEIDARILADQLLTTIAVRTSLPVQVIQAYERTFFDVRPRLQADAYIRHTVLRRGAAGPLLWHDVPQLWKWFGYLGGGLIIDLLCRSVEPAMLDQFGVDAYLRSECEMDRSLKLWILAARLPIPTTPKGIQKQLELFRILWAQTDAARVAAERCEPPDGSSQPVWNEAWNQVVRLIPDIQLAA
jgi:hypothetical protein